MAVPRIRGAAGTTMSGFRFRSLSQIFLIGVVLISVPLLVGTVLTFFYIERLANDSQRLVVRSLEIGRETEKLIGHIEDLNRTARQYVIVGDEELYNVYTQKHFRLVDTLDWLELLVDKPEAQHVLEQIRTVSQSAFEQIKDAAQSPDATVNDEKFARLAELSDSLRDSSGTAIRNQLNMASSRVETARLTLYWIWALSALFIALFVVILVWGIARPIRRFDSQIRRLGQGEFGRPISIHGPTDIAELGARLDWLRRRLGEVDQIKERFFREMSHQLKTPLASIREGAGLLMDESGRMDRARQDEVLTLVQNNSIELQRMLDNMLNFSAWRADPENLYREKFELRPLLDALLARFQPLLMAHGLRLEVDCSPTLSVHLDRAKCRVVLDNLISNAVKFSPDHGCIRVRAAKRQRAVHMEVEDQGPGIPVEARGRIFELFYLGEPPASCQSRGTGVGLALVRAYVEAHGGRVAVESTGGSGVRFRVKIPQ